jgi:hypothetical protein
MAFVYEIPGITSVVSGNKLSLSVGDIRAYNHENLYGKKTDAEKQINHLSALSEYALSEHQFAQLVGKSRLYQYLPLKTRKALDMVVPISDSQISTVGRDYYQDKSFCREDSGDINLWKVYGLFTSAIKSSYIDTFLDRNVGSLLFINSLVQHLKNDKQSWFLT